MNGDLGNLLTGELGEGEARFSHEDFAADYGQRIAGRVRRRRAVRAAGIGGGTMLTAGALVLGATQIPWGVFGAAPGMGVTDCVTPSPSDGANLVTVTLDASDRTSVQMVVPDPTTGGVRLTGVEHADGTWVFTDADGNPVEATLIGDGRYGVRLGGTSGNVVLSLPSASPSPLDQSTSGSFTYTVEAPDGAASPSPSDDCYTPSPTPSGDPNVANGISQGPDPSLAARPEDVTSPFQCGFEFPTESLKSDDLWIDGAQWMERADASTAIGSSFSYDPSQAPDIGDSTDPVPVVTVHFAGTETGNSAAITWGTSEPSIDDIEQGLASDTSSLKGSEGATFVGVADGRVVATGNVHPDPSGNVPPAYLDLRSYEDGSFLYLLDPAAALTSCDANPVDFSSIDLYAVAGLIVKRGDNPIVGPTYAWLPVGEP